MNVRRGEAEALAHGMIRVRQLAAMTLATGIALATSAPAHAAPSDHPVSHNPLSANVVGALADIPPPGANVRTCRPSSRHPHPVVLLHGIVQNQNMAWRALAPTLANAGYCVYTVTYGKLPLSGNFGGLDELANSVSQVNDFVEKVLASTKTHRVDLVGYSEGGYIARLYLRTHGPKRVGKFIGLAPLNSSPPDISGLLTTAYLVPGAAELLRIVSPAVYELSHRPAYDTIAKPSPTFPEVEYTNIASETDEVATPYTLSFLPNARNVVNITLQDTCPKDRVGHFGVPYDRSVVQMTLNALDPDHPVEVRCTHGFGL